MPETKIKGTAFINRYDYLQQTHGEETLSRVLARLSEADAKTLRLPNAAEWYPMETVLRVDDAIVAEVFGGDESRMAEIGELTLMNSLTRFYRFLFRVLNTDTMLKNGVAAFRKSVSEGAPTFEIKGTGDLIVRYEGFDPHQRSYCHFLRGALVGVLKACGTNSHSVEEVGCRLKGDAACAFRVRWT
ncbi:MAG: hypothetical protein ACOX6T_03640 [Myxococcales bacterium]|jgi:hypothetical protein